MAYAIMRGLVVAIRDRARTFGYFLRHKVVRLFAGPQ
jgi:hypothetical protein